MHARNWSLFLLPYEQAVEELKVKFKTMRAELKKREEYAPVEFVTGRVKQISSILDKARRLNVPLDEIEVGIEDIAGIRIMCQFVDDIRTVVEYIRLRKDLIVVTEKDYIANFKDSGYRSFHMIVQYPVQTASGQKYVLAELQIRTLAMNFWATIEHSLSYKYKQSLPDDIRERLKKASEAAFVLDNEMSAIRLQTLQAQKDFEEDANIVSKILSTINQLYFYHRVAEAINIQHQFNKIWEHKDMEQMTKLLDTARETLSSAQKGGITNDLSV